MAECTKCGTTTNISRECPYCGNTHCSEHALPENHKCYGIQNWEPKGKRFESGHKGFDNNESSDRNLTDKQQHWRVPRGPTADEQPDFVTKDDPEPKFPEGRPGDNASVRETVRKRRREKRERTQSRNKPERGNAGQQWLGEKPGRLTRARHRARGGLRTLGQTARRLLPSITTVALFLATVILMGLWLETNWLETATGMLPV